MLINLALLQMDSALSGISVFTIKSFFNLILKSLLKRNLTLINPKTFMGDAAFDSIEIYKYLLQETSFEKTYIPLKNELKIKGIDYTVNEDGVYTQFK